MSRKNYLLDSIKRAIRAEEKQGFINTGAMVSFSSFLQDTIPELSQFFSEHTNEKLRTIISDYSRSSPITRRGLLAEIKEVLFSVNYGSGSGKTFSSLKPKADKISGNLSGVIDKQYSNNRTASLEKQGLPQQDRVLDLQYLKGVGPRRMNHFAGMGIKNVEQLLKHYPRRYEIRVERRIEELTDGELATVCGTVTGSQLGRNRIKVVKLKISQENRSIYAVWFNQVHIIKQYPVGTIVSVSGKVRWNGRVPEILAVDINKGHSEGSKEKIVPIYSETAFLSSRIIREVMRNALPWTDKLFPEVLPPGETDLMARSEAYREIHFPSSQDKIIQARERLVVEEILFLQLALERLRSPRKNEKSPVLDKGGELVREFITRLPFFLTQAQKRVMEEVFRDMAVGDKSMTRLIQGDVGSGKTVVAMAAILQAVGTGYQGAMMAPTEVLAQQHYELLSKAFNPLGVKTVLLAGSQSKSEREGIIFKILSGKAQVVVGTQALIQEGVQFNALGLVVTDEQHRFGVRQRTQLKDKGDNPHVLVMTATPIPRTLALTAYGDLQLSVLDELPAGRKPVITKKISERFRPRLENFLEQQVREGRQVYVVCPLVEETEKTDLVSATQRAEVLQKSFPDKKVDLLHGRMKTQEKEEIMQRFRRAETDILVATTVVEVGVNVPNATVMVVEGAERFGLAQLHQLRGRVGRGAEQSYCILISDSKESTRLNILCQTEDGFRIAEEDLKIRGPGELLGLRQHGVPELQLTDLIKDAKLVETAYLLLQRSLAYPQRFAKLHQEIYRLYGGNKIGVN